jgi:K+-sensing histidine kinase KdpD
MRRISAASTPTTGPPRRTGHGSAWSGGLAREDLLGVLSHELRTPVTTIYGGAHLLATRDLSEDRRRAVASDVGQEAEHLYRIVEDLLVLLRTERGAIAPVGEPVAIGRLIVSAIEREVERNPRQQIRYLGSRDAAIDGVDEQLIAHVVRNLLANAMAESTEDRPIEIVVDSRNDEVVVRFLDLGPLPAEASDFEPSVDGWPQARGSLALFAAGRLIEAMHGHSWVRARAGGGAEFGFALPGRPPGPASTPEAEPVLAHE